MFSETRSFGTLDVASTLCRIAIVAGWNGYGSTGTGKQYILIKWGFIS
jgi:hypothetical protein